ncbi:MAG: sigma-70 family RNA polymerase sigma factor, partial [Anaerolineales bacterium]
EGEAELIRRAQQGDPAAFSELYDRHQPAIYRYIVFRVSTAATAEALTSDVFVRLVDRIDRFKYRGRPLLAWLYTIARNMVADHHRRSGRYDTVPLDKIPAASGQEGPEDVVELRFDAQAVVRAISELTENQRQVILLKFAEGMDNAAAARVLGRSVGAVKALQHRALAALRRILEEADS